MIKNWLHNKLILEGELISQKRTAFKFSGIE